MKVTVLIALLAAAAALAACTSQTTRDVQAGPRYTEAQKEAMTEEERLAVYNSQVREKDQLECKRVRRVGSRLKDLVCKTATEAEIERASAREALRQSRGGSTGGGPTETTGP